MKCPYCNSEMLESAPDKHVCPTTDCIIGRIALPDKVLTELMVCRTESVALFVVQDCLNWVAKPKATGEDATFARKLLKKIAELTEPKEE